jgi:hypothetical protein
VPSRKFVNGRAVSLLPRPMDWSKMRHADEISKDLVKQLEEILAKQKERWKCP